MTTLTPPQKHLLGQMREGRTLKRTRSKRGQPWQYYLAPDKDHGYTPVHSTVADSLLRKKLIRKTKIMSHWFSFSLTEKGVAVAGAQ